MANASLRADIEAAKAQMPNAIGTGREVKKLVEHLWDGETVDRMVGGTYGKGTGLVVLTSKRVLFLLHGMMSQQSEDFPIEKISSIQWSSGLALGTITIFVSGNKAEIKNVSKTAGKLLVDVVRDRIANFSKSQPAAESAIAAPGQVDIIGQIKKLSELRDAGILTDEEFVEKKSELMSRL